MVWERQNWHLWRGSPNKITRGRATGRHWPRNTTNHHEQKPYWTQNQHGSRVATRIAQGATELHDLWRTLAACTRLSLGLHYQIQSRNKKLEHAKNVPNSALRKYKSCMTAPIFVSSGFVLVLCIEMGSLSRSLYFSPLTAFDSSCLSLLLTRPEW